METQLYQQFTDLERDHWWFKGRRSVYLGLLQSHLREDTCGNALDLGCGLGGFLNGLEGLGFDIYGCDVDLECVSYCHQRGFVDCLQSNSYDLPFADNSFDLVTLFDAIEHIEDDHKAMAEIARVLKPGGRVIISVPAYQFLYANNDRVAQHYRRYNRTSVRALFNRANLQVERNSHSNVFLFPLILPLVLLSKLVETLIDRKKESTHSNLSWPLPRPIHALLHKIFAAELSGTRIFDWPAGHSIVAIARKNPLAEKNSQDKRIGLLE